MNNTELRSKIHELEEEISADIHHGECFYDEEMFKDFMNNLDKMKELSTRYFKLNKDED